MTSCPTGGEYTSESTDGVHCHALGAAYPVAYRAACPAKNFLIWKVLSSYLPDLTSAHPAGCPHLFQPPTAELRIIHHSSFAFCTILLYVILGLCLNRLTFASTRDCSGPSTDTADVDVSSQDPQPQNPNRLNLSLLSSCIVINNTPATPFYIRSYPSHTTCPPLST